MPHIHKLIDWCAGVYVVHDNKVLIRKHDKYDVWVHVGGHVELDEDPVTAAIRECKEEVGLDVLLFDGGTVPSEYSPNSRHLAQPAHMNIHYVGKTNHQHIDLIYYASADSDNVVPENENDKWVWLTAEEITSHPSMEPHIKHYAVGALAAIGNQS